MKIAVEKVLEDIRPKLAAHTGNVELVRVNEDTGEVFVRFQGACRGCPFSSMTLKAGIESALKEAVPKVLSVIDVDTV